MKPIHELLDKVIMNMKRMQGAISQLEHRNPQLDKTPEFLELKEEFKEMWSEVVQARKEL